VVNLTEACSTLHSEANPYQRKAAYEEIDIDEEIDRHGTSQSRHGAVG
jgi:hypothetical protein